MVAVPMQHAKKALKSLSEAKAVLPQRPGLGKEVWGPQGPGMRGPGGVVLGIWKGLGFGERTEVS